MCVMLGSVLKYGGILLLVFLARLRTGFFQHLLHNYYLNFPIIIYMCRVVSKTKMTQIAQCIDTDCYPNLLQVVAVTQMIELSSHVEVASMRNMVLLNSFTNTIHTIP